MYKVAICDKERYSADSLTLLSQKILSDLGVNHKVDTFHDGSKLIKVITADPAYYQIVLLDILELNGMDLARQIRWISGRVTIVFTTCFGGFVFDNYEEQSLQYLVKPVDDTALRKVFEFDCNSNGNNQFLTIGSGVHYRKIPIEHVIFLEDSGHQVLITLYNEITYDLVKLLELETRLPPACFIRCHQKYIINIHNVIEIRKHEAVMKTRRTVPIGRIYLKKVTSCFLRESVIASSDADNIPDSRGC